MQMITSRSMEVPGRSLTPGFTKTYNCERLVWYEVFENIDDAVHFEVRMKKWNRDWKVARIVERNPEWRDLFEEGLLP